MNRFASLVVFVGLGVFAVVACSSESLEVRSSVAGAAGMAQSGRAGAGGAGSGAGASPNGGGSPNAGVGGGSSGTSGTGGRSAGTSGDGGRSTGGTGGALPGEPCDSPGERTVVEDCCFGDCFPAMTCVCTDERFWSCGYEHPCAAGAGPGGQGPGGQGPGGRDGIGGEGGNR